MTNVLQANGYITKQQGDNLKRASVFASHYGMELNTFVTVHWANAGMAGNYRTKRQKLFELLSKWFSRRGSVWSAIWVTESGNLSKEVHVHLACHVPNHVPLRDLRKYLLSVLKADDNAVLDIRPIYDVVGLRRYMLKGCDPSLYAYFQIPEEHQHTQGVVWGKRCGCSKSIDAQARSERIAASKTETKVGG